MLVGAILLVVSLVIISALVLAWPYLKMLRAKKDFFNHAYRIVYEIARDKDYYLINDVALTIDTQVIHFNHVLFGEKYIYCIGDKYSKGALSGKFSDAQWFSFENNGKKSHIDNPLLLHKRRIDYLESAIKADDMIIGIMMCNDECLIDEVKDSPDNLVILNQKELKEYINKKEKSDISSIDTIQLDSLVHTIYKMNHKAKQFKL